VTQENVNFLNQYCFANEDSEGVATITDYNNASRKVPKEEIYSGNILTLTGTREAEELLSLTAEQTAIFKQRGRTIADIQQFSNFYPVDYSPERA
jgi:hypothetical protein